MNKTILIVYAAILVFLSSCYSTRTLSTGQQIEEFGARGDVMILTAVTREGETYYFNREAPAWIIDDIVTGPPKITISYDKASSVIRDSDGIPEYVEYNNSKYKIISLEKSNYICHATDSVMIPVNDLSYIKIVKQNDLAFGVVFIIVLGSVGFLAGVSLLFLL